MTSPRRGGAPGASNANGGCLSTGTGAAQNDVCLAPCGNGHSGQFRTADGKLLQNQNHSYLSFSGTGAAIHTVTTYDELTCHWFDYVVCRRPAAAPAPRCEVPGPHPFSPVSSERHVSGS
ncbi:hypothetical protein ACFYXS_20815 [Streptomyces sp. NPDC002574]|uniref:hypothetical protein n=1 Tax=Streptomyces sp. NPDC002574 TaxID=3364652 RepID=UPI0036BD6172